MAILFPLAYGTYLSLGLLFLQPLHGVDLAPLGVAVLIIFGLSLSNFIISLKSLPASLYFSTSLMSRVTVKAAAQILGVSALVLGLMAGTSTFFVLISLLFGQIAGLTWYRMTEGRESPKFARLGVGIGCLAILVGYFFTGGSASSTEFTWATPDQWMARTLTLTGAVFWGGSSYVFSLRRTCVAQKHWLFWEALFTFFLMLFAAGLIQAMAPDADLVSAGFRSEPIMMVPFLLFGAILGALRQQLVVKWEPIIAGTDLSKLWASSAVLTACVAGAFTDLAPLTGFDALLCGLMLMAFFLQRGGKQQVSNFTGLRQVIIGDAGSAR